MPCASTQNARSALRRLPTRPSRMVQAVVSRLLPLLFRSQGIELSNRDAAEALAKPFAAQQSGACNLLIAFRPPSTRDPLVMADLFWNGIPLAARRLKLQLSRSIQLRFLYDRGIPIWAGPVIGWLLQRSGGIAIHRGRLDRPALAQARGSLAQGRYPLLVAPSGATNNLSGEMAPLDPQRPSWRSRPLRIWRESTTSGRWRCCPLVSTTAGSTPTGSPSRRDWLPSNAISASPPLTLARTIQRPLAATG